MATNFGARVGHGGRPILSPRRIEQPPHEGSQIPVDEPRNDNPVRDSIQAFEAALWSARNQWSIARRRPGLFGHLDKHDASRLLERELAALAEVGEQ